MTLRIISIFAFALFLSGCGETETPDASPYAAGGQDADQVNAVEADGDTDDDAAAEADGPSELDLLARTVCEAGDTDFAAPLPDGAGFASRGPDARVHVAWSLDGERDSVIIHTPSLEQDARLAFDGAVADFLRRNMSAGDDRTGRTGAYRARDGRFCIVQAEAETVAPLRDAALQARALQPQD